MSLRTAEFLQRMATSINDSANCDSLLPALSQIRATCLKLVGKETGRDAAPDRNLCCRWCLNSWSLGQYSLRVIPQKRPRGFKALRSKYASNLLESTSSVKNRHRFICHHFLSLKCDVCLGVTKIPIPKPTKPVKEETPPLLHPVASPKKKKKTKKKDAFVGLNPTAVKSVKRKNVTSDNDANGNAGGGGNTGKQVVNVIEVLSPSSIQNGVNIVSNRTKSKNRSQPSSTSGNEKPTPTLKNKVKESPDLKISCVGKNKKKKPKSSREKSKKSTIASALASFLNSI